MNKQNMTEKAVLLLKQKLEEADDPALANDEDEFERWVQEVESILARRFGQDSRELGNFTASLHREVRGQRSFDDEEDTGYRKRQIAHGKATLEAILSVEETLGTVEMQEATTSSRPKAFIAHGGKTEALSKLQTFVAALGIVPLIAEEEASEDRSVDDQVEWCLDNADCAIILGTADDKELKDGKLYPRRNVHIEIGRVQERFPSRVIYLLEEGASFPSNITEKVREPFTQKNMENAFSKVAKELKAFGIITAISIRNQSD